VVEEDADLCPDSCGVLDSLSPRAISKKPDETSTSIESSKPPTIRQIRDDSSTL